MQTCASINAHLASLSYTYAEGPDHHSLSIADHPTIQFPTDAGGTVHGGSASWLSEKHEAGAIHEPGMIAALLTLAEERPSIRTVFDVGALFGYVSLVTRSLFPEVDVHAFESNPRSFRALRRNLQANWPTFGKTLFSHKCALSDRTQANASARVNRMGLVLDDPGSEDAGQEVELNVWSMDDYCDEHSLSPDLIKLDVEGYQAKIIPGARKVIERSRPVILMEFDAPGAANDFGVTNREVIQPLLDDGYQLLWGKHRYADRPFEVVAADELSEQHEVNSLGILLP